MGAINKSERATQNRVVALFKDQLKYIYLGNLEDKYNNSNIEAGLLRQYLANKMTLERQNDHPESLNTGAKRALYNNLGQNESLALQVDAAILVSKSDEWRGHQAKENQIKEAIWKIVGDEDGVERIFAIVKQQNEY